MLHCVACFLQIVLTLTTSSPCTYFPHSVTVLFWCVLDITGYRGIQIILKKMLTTVNLWDHFVHVFKT